MAIPLNQMSVAQVTVAGTLAAGGTQTKNLIWNFYFQRIGVSPPWIPTTIETAFSAAIVPSLLLALNIAFTQKYNLVRCLNDATDPGAQVPRSGIGAVTGDPMVSFASNYVLCRTGNRGKHYRGAKHFAPLSESDTSSGSGNILNAGSISLWGTFLAAWLAGFTDGSGNVWIPVLFSRSLSQVSLNPTTLVVNPITQLLLNKRVGRMKRRETPSEY